MKRRYSSWLVETSLQRVETSLQLMPEAGGRYVVAAARRLKHFRAHQVGGDAHQNFLPADRLVPARHGSLAGEGNSLGRRLVGGRAETSVHQHLACVVSNV